MSFENRVRIRELHGCPSLEIFLSGSRYIGRREGFVLPQGEGLESVSRLCYGDP